MRTYWFEFNLNAYNPHAIIYWSRPSPLFSYPIPRDKRISEEPLVVAACQVIKTVFRRFNFSFGYVCLHSQVLSLSIEKNPTFITPDRAGIACPLIKVLCPVILATRHRRFFFSFFLVLVSNRLGRVCRHFHHGYVTLSPIHPFVV